LIHWLEHQRRGKVLSVESHNIVHAKVS
jgi:hypothetical protein